jgi:hypothetical protein
VLRNTDILHAGLRDLHAHGTTLRQPPPVNLHRPAYRRLHTLSLARTIGPGFLAGMVINALSTTSASGNPTYEMPVSSNQITFEENGGYALHVNWI